MKLSAFSVFLIFATFVGTTSAQTNTFPSSGNVGIGTTTPNSALTIRQSGTGLSIHPLGSGYYGAIAFNREVSNGEIFDPNGKAFQINNGGPDNNLHLQVYNGNGTAVDVDALVVSGTNANVGIGIPNPNEKLSVNGKIRAHEIKVEAANWPDYVFDQDYKILGLQELDAYIKQHKHLPDMPSSKEAEVNGVELGKTNKLLLKKVEELTLHLIDRDKALRAESAINIENQKRISRNEKELAELKEMLIKKVTKK